jgi:hypothetical protein
LGESSYAGVGVPRALGQSDIGGIAAIFGEQDSSDQRRVGGRERRTLGLECGRQERESDENAGEFRHA